MKAEQNIYKNKLLMVLNELPETQIREIYHFTIFLKNQSDEEFADSALPDVPVNHLHSLSGLISIGGDAVQDTENLYHV